MVYDQEVESHYIHYFLLAATLCVGVYTCRRAFNLGEGVLQCSKWDVSCRPFGRHKPKSTSYIRLLIFFSSFL